MIGSMRVLPAPGGHSVWTFHFPFIAAAMVLGGPTAGAWVAFVSTLERREMESVPWYGTLANHSVLALRRRDRRPDGRGHCTRLPPDDLRVRKASPA